MSFFSYRTPESTFSRRVNGWAVRPELKMFFKHWRFWKAPSTFFSFFKGQPCVNFQASYVLRDFEKNGLDSFM